MSLIERIVTKQDEIIPLTMLSVPQPYTLRSGVDLLEHETRFVQVGLPQFNLPDGTSVVVLDGHTRKPQQDAALLGRTLDYLCLGLECSNDFTVAHPSHIVVKDIDGTSSHFLGLPISERLRQQLLYPKLARRLKDVMEKRELGIVDGLQVDCLAGYVLVKMSAERLSRIPKVGFSAEKAIEGIVEELGGTLQKVTIQVDRNSADTIKPPTLYKPPKSKRPEIPPDIWE